MALACEISDVVEPLPAAFAKRCTAYAGADEMVFRSSDLSWLQNQSQPGQSLDVREGARALIGEIERAGRVHVFPLR